MFTCCGILYNHESPLRPVDFLPRKVARAAAAISLGLERELILGDLSARRDWGSGIAALVGGRMEDAVRRLDESEARFHLLCQPHTAANTQVSKLIALAMLGRYEEAVETGLRARDLGSVRETVPAANPVAAG